MLKETVDLLNGIPANVITAAATLSGVVATGAISLVTICISKHFEGKQKREDWLKNAKLPIYESLMEGLPGFYEPKDRKLINQFLLSRNKLSLFASDDMITAINSFLDSVSEFNTGQMDDKERQKWLQKLLFEARKDCLAEGVTFKTKLPLEAFKQMRPRIGEVGLNNG
jgi:hypothetical protein